MKKVLATLLAVLLLTCVFGTVAMAATAPEPADDPNNYNYGYKTFAVSINGRTTVKDGDHIKLDKSTVEKPSNGEIEKFLNNTYVADPPEFTVHCVAFGHVHAITKEGELPNCRKGWVKESNSHYTCDGGYWKVVDSSVGGKSNVVKAQWCCPYQRSGKHNIFITITYKPAHTHVYEEKVKDTNKASDATCTEPAKYYKICECGEKSQETFEVGEKDPNNHKGPMEWVDNHDDTEGKLDGTHVQKCTACTETLISSKEAHKWVKYGGTPATEDTDGKEQYECSVCYAEKEITIPKLPHTHVKGTKHEAVPGTCIAKGTIEYYECTGCDAKLDAQGNVLESIEGEYGEHGELIPHAWVPAKCLTDGMEAYYECSLCHRAWYDEDLKEEVGDKDDLVIEHPGHMYVDTDWETNGPANHKHYCFRNDNPEYGGIECDAVSKEATIKTEAHTWGEWYPVEGEPTKEERQCTKCTEKQTRTIGCNHMWTEIKREPTCLEDGYQADKCIKCTLIVREQVLPAPGHDWGEWEVVTPATTEAEGLEKRVCKRDPSHVETRPIEKLKPTPEPTMEPTAEPTAEPTMEPTAEPTMEPTAEPTMEPTAEPTAEPTVKPTKKPDIPKTGDNSHFGYAYLMIAVAAAGLVVLAATRRKEGSK